VYGYNEPLPVLLGLVVDGVVNYRHDSKRFERMRNHYLSTRRSNDGKDEDVGEYGSDDYVRLVLDERGLRMRDIADAEGKRFLLYCL
jgi:hypothetical protein